MTEVKFKLPRPSFLSEHAAALIDASVPFEHQIERVLGSATSPLSSRQISEALHRPEHEYGWRLNVRTAIQAQIRHGSLVRSPLSGPPAHNGQPTVLYALAKPPVIANGIHIPHFVVIRSIRAKAVQLRSLARQEEVAQRMAQRMAQRVAKRMKLQADAAEPKAPVLNNWAVVSLTFTEQTRAIEEALRRVGAPGWLEEDMQSECMLHLLEGGDPSVEALIGVALKTKTAAYRGSVMGWTRSIYEPLGNDPDGRLLIDTL